ncbi:MAG: hypothetical protein ACJ76Z_02415 [Thermoleophilaceae bacterium]
MKQLKIIGVALCALALVVPAGVLAKKPDNPGSKGKGHTHACKPGKKVPSVGFVVRGTYVSGDASGITLTVTGANHHAKRVVTVGQPYTTPAVDISKITFVGRDAFGGANPPQAGDKVQVIGKIAKPHKGCDADSSYTIRKVVISAPDTTNQEQPEQPAQS